MASTPDSNVAFFMSADPKALKEAAEVAQQLRERSLETVVLSTHVQMEVVAPPLHLFQVFDELIAAFDRDDAWAVFAEVVGMEISKAKNEYGEDENRELADDTVMNLRLGPDGKLADEDEWKTATLTEIAAGELARRHGRGLVGSSNY